MKKSSKDECKILIEEFGLSNAINKKVGAFSKGMVQRLGMARALIDKPPILILDEPSGGLDPRGVILIRSKIREMKNKGSTILVSSHILSEVQEICDRVCIINKGEIVAQDTVEGLRKKLNIKPKITIELEKISDNIIKSVNEVKGIETPIGMIPKYENLKELFKGIDKEYPKDLYDIQFSFYVDNILGRIALQEEAYKKEDNISEKLFKIYE